jgi:hypothetical protein
VIYSDDTLFTAIENNDKFKEMVDIITLARAFGAGRFSPLDIFIAYDLSSFEGFHIFGIDAFNDIVATEAGFVFSQNVQNGLIGRDPAQLAALIDLSISTARKEFLRHNIMKERMAVVDSFSSLMTYMKGNHFAPVVDPTWAAALGEDAATIWKKTTGMVIERNMTEGRLGTKEDRQTFITSVTQHIQGLSRRSGLSPFLTDDEANAIDQAIELLMLIDHPLDGRN